MNIEQQLLKLFEHHEKTWVSKAITKHPTCSSNVYVEDIRNAVFDGRMIGSQLKNAIEHHFLVCFPYETFDKKWTFSNFATYVGDRANKPSVNLRLAKKRAADNDISPLVVLVFLSVFILFGWQAYTYSYFVLLALPLPLLLLAGILDNWYYARRYHALSQKIEHKLPNNAISNQTQFE